MFQNNEMMACHSNMHVALQYLYKISLRFQPPISKRPKKINGDTELLKPVE